MSGSNGTFERRGGDVGEVGNSNGKNAGSGGKLIGMRFWLLLVSTSLLFKFAISVMVP
jgi:hypothetical protein